MRKMKWQYFVVVPIWAIVTAAMLIKKDQGREPSFCKAYEHYFPIGTAINPLVDLNDNERTRFIAYHYNSITPENQMKMKFIHPAENKYNWMPADRIVEYARKNGMKVRGHVLIWHQGVPGWLISQEDGSRVDKMTLFKKMKDHIDAVVGRYKNDVYCWDVVNESISDKDDEVFKSKDTLFQIGGEEYIEQAFRFARAADPQAKLFYNDYRFTNPVKRQKIFDLLKRMKQKGVPIDGVGMQSHYTPGEINAHYLQETIDMFKSIGLEIQVTELDVSVYPYRNKESIEMNKDDSALTEKRLEQQASTYKMLFETYRKNKGTITNVTFWGATDLSRNFRYYKIGKRDYPFIFDEMMQPKKYYTSIISF